MDQSDNDKFDKFWEHKSAPFNAAETIEVAYYTRRVPTLQGMMQLGIIYHLDSDPENIFRCNGSSATIITKKQVAEELEIGSIAEVPEHPRMDHKKDWLWLKPDGNVIIGDKYHPFENTRIVARETNTFVGEKNEVLWQPPKPLGMQPS
jgi:hypothetical protein